MRKKSQIAIFMILGLFIVGSFYIMYSMKHQSITKNMEKSVTTVAVDELKLQEIRAYTQSCVDRTLARALELITLQGGTIFDYQEGSLFSDRIPYVEFQGVNVSYQIFKPEYYPLETLDKPPFYPCHASDPLCAMGKSFVPSKENIYCCGKNPTLSICKWSGDYCFYRYNHTQSEHLLLGIKGKSQLCTRSIAIGSYSCTCPSEPCVTSIEAQVKHYVDTQIFRCLNYSIFKSYNISIGTIYSNLTIGKEDVSLDILLPLDIHMQDYAPTRQEIFFKAKQPVRLLQLFTLIFGMGSVNGLIDYEIRNISYDIVRDGQELANKYGFFTIEKHDIPEFKASIITVNDTSDVSLNGKNAVFQFAIQKRNPALDYLSIKPFGSYDVFVTRGDSIKFKPDAYDPDEDNLIYTYHGWNTNSPGPDRLNSEAVADFNYWETSDYYTDKTLCVVTANKGMQEHVCAFNQTSESDLGLHRVTIEVTDQDGYKDWQTLRVLVAEPMNPRIDEDSNNPFHKACKANDGSKLSYKAIEGKPFYLDGYCGGVADDYNFIWSFSPDSSLGSSYSHTIFNGCTDSISPPPTFSAGTVIVTLTVQNLHSGFSATPISRTINVYMDNDEDDYCADVGEPDEDCADNYKEIHPGATEICDNEDNDCDGDIDSADIDLELADCALQYGECSGSKRDSSLCVGGVWQPCLPANYAAHSANYEVTEISCCDGLVDNDCDNQYNCVDPDCYGDVICGCP